jgi:hypothetical protein
LHPNQGFVVTLHGRHADVKCNSHFFHAYRVDRSDDHATFHFHQKFDLSRRPHTRLHLGEVLVFTENKCGSLCVFLENDTRSIMTIINPDTNVINVDPNTLLKIVIFDSAFQGKWDHTIISGQSGIKYNFRDYTKYSSNIWNWADLFECRTTFEHHYNFYCPNASHLDKGTHQAGKIVFDTNELDGVFKVLNLNIRIKNKEPKTYTIISPTPVNGHAQRVRKYVPQMKDAILRQNITFKKKECSDLHSNKVLYF